VLAEKVFNCVRTGQDNTATIAVCRCRSCRLPLTCGKVFDVMLSRPDSTEYAEFYTNYIARVPDGNVLDFLTKQPGAYRQLLAGIPDAAAEAEPAPGKWSIKQVLGHICDAERVMTYRALRFARGDEQELRGFEQDDYVREANSNSRSLEELLAEFESVRKATIALFGSLPAGTETRRGIANGNPVSVRALAYIAAGHAQHHYEGLKATAKE
jgi:DinB superfamily